ncbi:MAG: holo-ACP synthase [Myxococcota bacterium]
MGMTVVGMGMDLVEVTRIQAALERHGERFLHRVWTEAELAYCLGRGLQRDESLAARFAAKEATWKALGVPPGLRFTEMEVVSGQAGRAPYVRLSGRAKEASDRMGATGTMLTMTHAGGVAGAVVLLTTSGVAR